MRQKRTAQATIVEVFSDHELGRELQTMSTWLDAHRSVLTAVMNDLCRRGLKPTGRCGLSAESVLRCAVLKQHRQLSYDELAFYVRDSASFQAFARLPMHWCPKKSALQHVIAAIQPQTWELINRALMKTAATTRIEPAQRIRIDSTVTDSPIHAPSDSHLLWDGVRVMVRLLKAARALLGAPTTMSSSGCGSRCTLTSLEITAISTSIRLSRQCRISCTMLNRSLALKSQHYAPPRELCLQYVTGYLAVQISTAMRHCLQSFRP